MSIRPPTSIALAVAATVALLGGTPGHSHRGEWRSIGAGAVPEAHFAFEEVRLTVDEGMMRIDGRYVFLVPPAEPLALLYPFPDDTTLRDPEILAVRFSQGDEVLACRGLLATDGLHLMTWPTGAGSVELRVSYRQRSEGRRAIYLLTTARAWSAPLDSARLEVDWPDSLGSPVTGLPFTVVDRKAGRTILRFEARPFEPDRDLEVSWNGP